MFLYALFFILGLLPLIVFFIQNKKMKRHMSFFSKYLLMKKIVTKLVYQTDAKIEEDKIVDFTIFFLEESKQYSLILEDNGKVFLCNKDENSVVSVTAEIILNYLDLINKQETNENSAERK